MLSGFAYMLAGKVTFLHPFHCCRTWCGVCESLPSEHVLTECHSTTSLNRIGKCVANTKLQDLMENTNQSFTTLGIQEKVDIDLSSVRLFILSLYGIKARNSFLLDQLQYFLASTSVKPASHLTPTGDASKQHVLRARYQTNI